MHASYSHLKAYLTFLAWYPANCNRREDTPSTPWHVSWDCLQGNATWCSLSWIVCFEVDWTKNPFELLIVWSSWKFHISALGHLNYFTIIFSPLLGYTMIVTLDLSDLFVCMPFQINVFQFLSYKVLSGLYAGTDSGITAQHLEWVHSFSLYKFRNLLFPR